MASIGGRLREQRERAGLSLGQVGTYEGLTPQYLSGLERGRNNPPTWDLLARLARRYDCTADYLLGLSQYPNGYAPEVPISASAKEAVNLIDSLPPERRAAAVSVLRSILEFAEVGVPLPDPVEIGANTLPEPVPARQGGGVTNSRYAELGPQQILNTGNEAAGDDSAQDDTARKDALLALLKKMLTPDAYEYVETLVAAGLPLTEADINRLLKSGGQQSFGEGFELPDDEGTIS